MTPEQLKSIRPGTKLTILVPNGKSVERIDGKATGRIVQDWKEATGTVVICNTGHGNAPAESFALNMGGRFGTPGFADAKNIVKIGNKRISTKKRPDDDE